MQVKTLLYKSVDVTINSCIFWTEDISIQGDATCWSIGHYKYDIRTSQFQYYSLAKHRLPHPPLVCWRMKLVNWDFWRNSTEDYSCTVIVAVKGRTPSRRGALRFEGISGFRRAAWRSRAGSPAPSTWSTLQSEMHTFRWMSRLCIVGFTKIMSPDLVSMTVSWTSLYLVN